MDVVDKKKRSEMMAGIKANNTRPELIIRCLLHSKGFRYKLHDKSLPGKPDMVFPKYKAVIQVHGCFWHMHECHLFKWPSTRPDFWKEKLESNRERDLVNLKKLHDEGWKSLFVWECAVKGETKLSYQELYHSISAWLINDPNSAELLGRSE